MKSIGEKIADGIQKFYTAFINQRVLTTPEEVQANTNEKNLASAVVVGEIYNNLAQGRVQLVVNDDGTLGYRLDGADAVIPFRKATPITMLKYFQKQSDTSAATYTYTLTDDVSTLLIQYVAAVGSSASNLPTVSVNGVSKTGFTLRQMAKLSVMNTFAYYLVVNDLKKGDTLIMTSPYWGTNVYELQLWGC